MLDAVDPAGSMGYYARYESSRAAAERLVPSRRSNVESSSSSFSPGGALTSTSSFVRVPAHELAAQHATASSSAALSAARQLASSTVAYTARALAHHSTLTAPLPPSRIPLPVARASSASNVGWMTSEDGRRELPPRPADLNRAVSSTGSRSGATLTATAAGVAYVGAASLALRGSERRQDATVSRLALAGGASSTSTALPSLARSGSATRTAAAPVRPLVRRDDEDGWSGDDLYTPAATVSRGCTTSTATQARGLVGLVNLGNTCFMNSCLQCLSHLPPLTSYFTSGAYTRDLNRSRGALAAAYAELMSRLWAPSPAATAESPRRVKAVVGGIASRFMGYDQQDAQEFMRFLVDALHEDVNTVTGKPVYRELVERPCSDAEMGDEWWAYEAARSASVVKGLFAGQLFTRLTCGACGGVTRGFDPFWDLSLPIPKSAQLPGCDACDITDCLRAFVKEEELAGGEAPYCAKCRSHKPAVKRTRVWRLPRILVLHIKRFTYSTYRRTKLNTSVHFPTCGLDVSDCIDAASPHISRSDCVYDLTGVSLHSGSLGGGHYTAQCKCVDDGKWYDFNDSRVTPMGNAERISKSGAYVLFFVRVGAVGRRE